MHKPTDSVRIVVFKDTTHQQFLVLTETDDPINWKLPGGKFEGASETPDDAASRELQEELGISGELVRLRPAARLLNDDGRSARYIYYSQLDDVVIATSAEIYQTKWVDLATIPDGPNKEHMRSAVSCALSAPKA